MSTPKKIIDYNDNDIKDSNKKDSIKKEKKLDDNLKSPKVTTTTGNSNNKEEDKIKSPIKSTPIKSTPMKNDGIKSPKSTIKSPKSTIKSPKSIKSASKYKVTPKDESKTNIINNIPNYESNDLRSNTAHSRDISNTESFDSDDGEDFNIVNKKSPIKASRFLKKNAVKANYQKVSQIKELNNLSKNNNDNSTETDISTVKEFKPSATPNNSKNKKVIDSPSFANLAKILIASIILFTVGFVIYCQYYYVSPLKKVEFLTAKFIIITMTILLLDPLPQDLEYHKFADNRSLCCVPNAFDVISNFPFLIFGIMGLLVLDPSYSEYIYPVYAISELETMVWRVFFIGCTLTSIGSAYYHWRPNNARLVWDRLPMTICFMAIFYSVLEDRLRPIINLAAFDMENARIDFYDNSVIYIVYHYGWALFGYTLLSLGFFSVVYWAYFDDLRIYFIVQFFPILAIPYLIILFPAHYTGQEYILASLGWYILAKILEVLDRPIFRLSRFISGHTLKHLISSISMYLMVKMLLERQVI